MFKFSGNIAGICLFLLMSPDVIGMLSMPKDKSYLWVIDRDEGIRKEKSTKITESGSYMVKAGHGIVVDIFARGIETIKCKNVDGSLEFSIDPLVTEAYLFEKDVIIEVVFKKSL